MSKCNADVFLMPVLVCVEYFLLQTHGSIVWKNPPLSPVQPLGAGLSLTLMQARQLCLTNTQKPPRVASYHHSEDLSQGCLSSWGRFFPLMSRLKSQCCRSNSLKQLFIKGRGQERRREGERSENKQSSVLCRWP